MALDRFSATLLGRIERYPAQPAEPDRVTVVARPLIVMDLRTCNPLYLTQ